MMNFFSNIFFGKLKPYKGGLPCILIQLTEQIRGKTGPTETTLPKRKIT